MIDSPCQHICVLKNGVCIGCQRTVQEIAKWLKMSDDEKQKVLERIKEKKK